MQKKQNKETKVNQIWIHPSLYQDFLDLRDILENLLDSNDPKRQNYQGIRNLIEKSKLPF